MTDPGQNIRRRAEQLRQLVSEARAEAASDDYAVRVVVGPGGAVHDVDVTARAARYGGAELGALIVEQLREANRRLNAELTGRFAEVMGEDAADAGLEASALGGLPTAAEVAEARAAGRSGYGDRPA